MAFAAKLSRRKDLIETALYMLTGAAVLFSVYVLGLLATGLIFGFGPDLLWVVTQPWSIPFLILAAYCLYLLRLRARAIYGILEVALGILTIVATIMKDDAVADVAHFTRVAAGIYVIIRGMDNFENGLEGLRNQIGPGAWLVLAYIWYQLKLDSDGFQQLKMKVGAN